MSSKQAEYDFRNKIYVTEVSGCQLPFYFETNKNYDTSPAHVKSMIGTMTHSLVEQLVDNEGEIKHDSMEALSGRKKITSENRDVMEHAHEASFRYLDRARDWIANTNLLDYEKNYILDFKTGKNRLYKSVKTQLGGYYWLVNSGEFNDKLEYPASEVSIKKTIDKHGIKWVLSGRVDLLNMPNGRDDEFEAYVVYLGEKREGKVERRIPSNDLKMYKNNFVDELQKTIDEKNRIIRGYRPNPPSFCPLAQFCKYRGVCTGI